MSTVRIKIEHPLIPSGTNTVIELTDVSTIAQAKRHILSAFPILEQSNLAKYQLRLIDANIKKTVRDNPSLASSLVFEWPISLDSNTPLVQTTDEDNPQRYIIFFEELNPKGGLTTEEIKLWEQLKVKTSPVVKEANQVVNIASLAIDPNAISGILNITNNTTTVKFVVDNSFELDESDCEDEEDITDDEDEDKW